MYGKSYGFGVQAALGAKEEVKGLCDKGKAIELAKEAGFGFIIEVDRRKFTPVVTVMAWGNVKVYPYWEAWEKVKDDADKMKLFKNCGAHIFIEVDAGNNGERIIFPLCRSENYRKLDV